MIRLLYYLRKPFRYRQFNAVYILIGINVGVFVLSTIVNMILVRVMNLEPGSNVVAVFAGLYWNGVISFKGVWQFITYMFMHDLSIFHLLFNMLILYMIGRPLEQKLGSSEFLFYYLLTGVLSGLLHFFIGGIMAAAKAGGAVIAPDFDLSMSPLIGASGAVFAVLLAFGVYYSEMIIYLFGVFPIKARNAVLLFGALELFNLLPGVGQAGVSNLTHVGGLLAGWLFLLIRKNINPAKVLFKKRRY